jgi:hypothetical protein
MNVQLYRTAPSPRPSPSERNPGRPHEPGSFSIWAHLTASMPTGVRGRTRHPPRALLRTLGATLPRRLREPEFSWNFPWASPATSDTLLSKWETGPPLGGQCGSLEIPMSAGRS